MTLSLYLAEAATLLHEVAASPQLISQFEATIDVLEKSLSQGLPLLVCGNGGSAADAQHITGELVGRYLKERPALNVICLADNAAVLTALANDYAFDQVFSRQVEAYGKPGGVVLGISTSGNSANVVNALIMAKKMGMKTIALTGMGGGKLAPLADYLIAVPTTITPAIQQVHLCLYHYLCEQLEIRLFAEKDSSLRRTAVS